MVEVVEDSRIAHPPEVVWKALSDFGAISRWAPKVDHSSLTTDRAEDVGTTRRVQVGRTALLERVTGWEPTRRLSYEIDGLPPVVRSATNTWELAASGDDTKVTLTSHIDAGHRPPQQLIARVVGRAMAKASREMLAGLQQHLEENPT